MLDSLNRCGNRSPGHPLVRWRDSKSYCHGSIGGIGQATGLFPFPLPHPSYR
jgi:hypothetical protein